MTLHSYSGAKGADPRLVRGINQEAVFSILKKNQAVSVSQISRLSGLSLATVKTVLENLKAYELIREIGEGVSAGGRKPKLYSLNLVDVYLCGECFSKRCGRPDSATAKSWAPAYPNPVSLMWMGRRCDLMPIPVGVKFPSARCFRNEYPSRFFSWKKQMRA